MIGLGPDTPGFVMPSSPLFEVAIDHHVPVPMRDGTRLNAIIWRPTTPGRYPVIVERVEYELIRRCRRDGEYFAARGYVFVGQSLRGMFDSEGAIGEGMDDSFLSTGGRSAQDPAWDGYDTIEWAAAQPWSNGNVGMVDGSSSGWTQYICALGRPPHLRALYARQGLSDRRTARSRGGALRLETFLLGSIIHIAEDCLHPAWMPPELQPAKDVLTAAIAESGTLLHQLPLKSWPPLLAAPQARATIDQLNHLEDGAYWKPFQLQSRYAEVDTPIFHLGGWFDIFLDETLRAYQGIRRHGRTAECREHQRLLVGPWNHGWWSVGTRKAGELDFGPEAEWDFAGHRLKWYGYWLRGIENGVLDEPRVRIFLMGANRWLDLDDWPPPNVEHTPLYLHAGAGPADASLNSGSLAWTPADAGESSETFAYDPELPVPSLASYPDWGPRDYRHLERMMLTYTSEPLEEEQTIIGPVKAILYAASTAPDTDWVVRLCDVYPDGRSMSVCDGILRARYRNSLDRPEFMVPGEIYRFEIDLWSTAQSFLAGHRLRVQVTSSDFPRYDRNLNTADPVGEGIPGQVATNLIHVDSAHPSCIVLPIWRAS